jgi:hypothetical protein
MVAEQSSDPPRGLGYRLRPENPPLVTQLAAAIEVCTDIADGLATIEPLDRQALSALDALALDSLGTLGSLHALTFDALRTLSALYLLAFDALRTLGTLCPICLLGTFDRGLAVVISFLRGRRSRQRKRGAACNPDHPGHGSVPVKFITINGIIWRLAPDQQMNRAGFGLASPHFLPEATRS